MYARMLGLLILMAVLANAIDSCWHQSDNGENNNNPPPTTGNLLVTVAFGAAGTHQCTGQGTVAITSDSGERKEQSYEFSGSAQSEAPGCRTNIQFNGIQRGWWNVEAGGVRCRKEVTGAFADGVTVNLAGNCS